MVTLTNLGRLYGDVVERATLSRDLLAPTAARLPEDPSGLHSRCVLAQCIGFFRRPDDVRADLAPLGDVEAVAVCGLQAPAHRGGRLQDRGQRRRRAPEAGRDADRDLHPCTHQACQHPEKLAQRIGRRLTWRQRGRRKRLWSRASDRVPEHSSEREAEDLDPRPAGHHGVRAVLRVEIAGAEARRGRFTSGWIATNSPTTKRACKSTVHRHESSKSLLKHTTTYVN
ncbi:hypothetical protein C2845_PM04G28680 [Panicum miliaceum]|uniref:Uncharacterized protein n=1 Tax=Panicum miliaceum TaxID=4540 RepID=A0A3L6QN27_PANMI|nr:hypothetical protein C2845_PM04G28680 [Panicum miliaceum]